VISASGIVAILLSQDIKDKITITGDIKSGLPPFKPPAFSLKNGNETISTGTIFKVSVFLLTFKVSSNMVWYQARVL